MSADRENPGLPAHPDQHVLERVVDSRGRRCPLPVIDLAKAMPAVPVGGVVVVLADDPAAAADIPAWCRMRGHDYLGAAPARDGSGQAHRIRRRG